MQYSPKLKKAMQQITAIMNENDIAGLVLLHTPGFSEVNCHLTTSYSAAVVDHEGVKIKLKEAEVGKAEAFRLADGTYNMMHHFVNHLAHLVPPMMNAEEQMRKSLDARTKPGGGFTPNTAQDN